VLCSKYCCTGTQADAHLRLYLELCGYGQAWNLPPYYLKRTTCPLAFAPSDSPIPTSVDVEPLLQGAAALEDACFEQGEDNSEGLGVTPRPSSPLAKVEPEDTGWGDVPVQPCPTSSSGMLSGAKGLNSGASIRRARKRVRLTSSAHQPLAYTAKPSTVTHHAEELMPLRVFVDAESFPASGSGAWVGQHKKGAKKKPWTVPDLVYNNFNFIEWDGR
jgi:hypothetical protein